MRVTFLLLTLFLFNSAFAFPLLDSTIAKFKKLMKGDPEKAMKDVLWTHRDHFSRYDFILGIPGMEHLQVEVVATQEEAKKLKKISKQIVEEDAKRRFAYSQLKMKYDQINVKVQELEEKLEQKTQNAKKLLEERDQMIQLIKILERRWAEDDVEFMKGVEA
ncbi:hypothetical protein L596_010697 [Steinernema carpocapsae]|uniref:SXP/RAL-2 family protein Ani s 5-like cation-binding domain-containing protein n=1 Tax=Steinernema carpocapsae TaxID=34508 RepID=A0A4U5PJ26_STECR|nr:hypothetical protein L596_010697 [Steinernema carpocapsae]